MSDERQPGGPGPNDPTAFISSVGAGLDPDAVSVELSSRRTGMSFQRTRMSADRTLMSVIRTALSLISFGFTIYQFFHHLEESKVIARGTPARTFGGSLIYIGIGMLGLGMMFHVMFMLGLRRERELLAKQRLIHAESQFPVSLTFLVAIALMIAGVVAVMSLRDAGVAVR